MQYKIREELQDFIIKGKTISNTTVIVTFLTDTLNSFYQILQNLQKDVRLVYEEDVLVGYEVSYAKINDYQLFKIFQEEDSVTLDECFISDLSLEKYLYFSQSYDNNPNDSYYCFPKKISAKLAFIQNIDFSKLNVEKIECFFYGTFFGGQSADFSKMSIKNGFFDFSRSYMNQKLVIDFSFSHIKKGDLVFNQTSFFENYKLFTALILNEGDIYFTGAFMEGGTLDFSYVDLKGYLIYNQIYAKNITLLLSQSSLEGMSFSLSEFRDSQLTLSYNKIKDGVKKFKELYLENSTLNFKESSFGEGSIDFSYLEAKNSDILFEKTSFAGNSLDFSYSKIQGYLSFQKADLGFMDIDLQECTLDAVDFSEIYSEGNINFRAHSCQSLSLKSASIRETFDIGHLIKFKYLQLSSLVLSGKIIINWEQNNVYHAIENIFIKDLEQLKENTRSNIFLKKNKELQLLKAETYRNLKENFNRLHRYIDEDKTYIVYRRVLREYKEKYARVRDKVWSFFEWLFLDVLGGYGTDPWRALFAIIFVWIAFSGAYYFIDSFYINETSELMTRIERSWYHSAITLFTIGYGDLIPKGSLMRALSILEGFFGVLLPSYFMIAFTRKMLR